MATRTNIKMLRLTLGKTGESNESGILFSKQKQVQLLCNLLTLRIALPLFKVKVLVFGCVSNNKCFT